MSTRLLERLKAEAALKPHALLCEKTLQKVLVARLTPYFTVSEEVKGTHISGKRLRIDMVLKPQGPGWANPNVSFGVELKARYCNHADLLAQCIDYNYTTWEGHSDMIILGWGLFKGKQYTLANYKDWSAIRDVAWRFNVGSIYEDSHCGITLESGMSTPIWREKSWENPAAPQLVEGRRMLFKRKVGSR